MELTAYLFNVAGKVVFWLITVKNLCLISYCLHTRHTLAVAAAAKSLQLCLTLCDPIDGSPPGSPVPGILPATVQLSHPYMTTGKTIALTRQTFVDKGMSLLFNMLSRLVITFFPRSKHLLISWLYFYVKILNADNEFFFLKNTM